MDFATSVPNEKPKPGSVSLYASGVFGESTIGMVSSIVTTQSWRRKTFKSVVLFLCVAGFLYQSVTFLLHVLEYPTVVGVDIQRPEDYIVPAYTFCTNNGMKRSVFCSLHPDRCYEPSEQFCSKWRSYCGRNKTLIPKKEYYELEDTVSFEDILKHGDILKDLIVFNKSEITENIQGPYVRTKDATMRPMICYNLHSVAESSETPLRKRTRSKFAIWGMRPLKANSRQLQISQPEEGLESTNSVTGSLCSTCLDVLRFRDPIDKLTLYIEEDEMLIPSNRPGVLFTVHSPYQAVNPFEKGIFMIPGRDYKIYVTMVEEILLQEPFLPTCMNYVEIWEANNRTGPRIQDMCIQKCIFEMSMKCYNCSWPDIKYPNEERKCKSIDEYNYRCTDADEDDYIDCVENCKYDCRVTKYYYQEFERYEVDQDETDDPEESRRYITVEIYVEDSEIVTLQHSPKYINVEVFSAIGGFIGVWLGISFMDVIDVFASAFSVCRYAVRKYQKQ